MLQTAKPPRRVPPQMLQYQNPKVEREVARRWRRLRMQKVFYVVGFALLGIAYLLIRMLLSGDFSRWLKD